MITQEYLKLILHYDPETGIFIWLVKKGPVVIGRRAGTVLPGHSSTYRRIKIGPKKYLEHRLAFLYMTGKMPVFVDHCNSDGTDNRWSNLRESTAGQNAANRSLMKKRQGQLKGAHWHQGSRTWRSEITFQGKRHYLGTFRTAEEAAQAYASKAQEFHGTFAKF